MAGKHDVHAVSAHQRSPCPVGSVGATILGRKPEIRMRQRISPRYFSLSTLLAISFGGLMLLAVDSVLVVSLAGAGRNTGELLADKADLILSSIEQRVRQHLGLVVAQAEYPRISIDRGQLDIKDAGALETALRSALAATPQVTGIGFIRSDLEVERVERRDGRLIIEDWSGQPEIIKLFEDVRAGKAAGWRDPIFGRLLHLHVPTDRRVR